MKAPEIIITGDGSHTLKLAGVDEHYHSVHGAIAESMHVFINAGLKKVLEASPGRVSILEVGFGTGLNALLTLGQCRMACAATTYTALEPFPLKEEIWKSLNYAGLSGIDHASQCFAAIHEGPWGDMFEPEPGFRMQKLMVGIQDYRPGTALHNLVYFDAFGPDVEPALWTEEIFENIAKLTAPNGLLVTYSAKGSVRRAMQKAGFSVERLQGPKGKREMLRATRL